MGGMVLTINRNERKPAQKIVSPCDSYKNSPTDAGAAPAGNVFVSASLTK